MTGLAATVDEPEAYRLDCTPAKYHTDPLPVPSLSASIANILVEESALHAWSAHPKFGAEPDDPTASTDMGTLVHRLVLGDGAEYDVHPFKDWRTKKAKGARGLSRAMGRIPVLEHAFEQAQATATSVRGALELAGIELDEGENELPIAWREYSEPQHVWCRALLDHWDLGTATIVDVKTCQSAHPRACQKAVLNHGYDVQQTAYVRGISKLYPHLAGRVDFLFAFVEVAPPFATYIARLDGVLRERGMRRWARAVDDWSVCVARNDWPAYGSRVGQIEAPAWLAAQMENE